MSASLDPARRRFEALARGPDDALDLEEAAILIAAEEYPELDVEAVRGELDELGEAARERLPEPSALGDCVAEFNRFLFREQGFCGADEYYDPRNSYLNEVLSRRRGIPITLSLVYMGVGRRAGLDARGISFPGHFLVRCKGPESGPGKRPGGPDADDCIVDAFHGRTLSQEDCEARLGDALGVGAVFDPAVHLRDAAPREILVRMLSNLQRIFAESGDFERLLSCCDRILLLTPEEPQALRERSMVYERLGWLAPAIADLETSLALLPEGEIARSVRARRDALRSQRGPLH